jgi:rare lipoprotein A
MRSGPRTADRRRRTAEYRWVALRTFAPVAALVLIYGCATTAPQPKPSQTLHGVASWYGEEFAGRTTANGEIFDPMLLTAAHRTLPFGTVVDVKNPKSGQAVRVRINDRGPFVGNRMIDLSYAAAQQIGLIDPGSGEVDVSIVLLGKGDREPPAPYTVTIGEPKEKAPIASGEPPKIDFPLPAQVVKPAPAPASADAGFKVDVVEEHAGVVTRKEVAPDGKTFVTVPVNPSDAATEKHEVASAPGHSAPESQDRKRESPAPPAARKNGGYVVQVGAFSVEANAKALQDQLTRIGQKSYVDHDSLYRVRIGPFVTRDEAVRTRTTLEANGISAIVVTQ